ncbi:MAG: orotate phosphoribosyltransferase [Cytophaga sp.]|uniref:orotate phosphoribosyltransferase n=1 Tax=Cytophaga sp. TaxID=29535 RepID=UPI003F7F1989
MNYKKEVALSLLKNEAVRLRPEEPFKWASGWNSPIYCDNRLTLSFPESRNLIRDGLVDLIRTHYPQCECIAGVATAGIPQAAIIADNMNLPMIYVRPKPKDHGMQNLIEGKITQGQKIVVIEDLISTGGSSLKAVEALQDGGFEVLGMIGIFTYGFQLAADNFSKAGITLHTLCNYDELIKEAQLNGYVKQDQLETLSEWRKSPETWKK